MNNQKVSSSGFMSHLQQQQGQQNNSNNGNNKLWNRPPPGGANVARDNTGTFPRIAFPSSVLPFQVTSASSTEICTQALNEVSTDFLGPVDLTFDEEIFSDAQNLEPIPINEGQMTVTTGQNSHNDASLMNCLERALNVVMHSEGLPMPDLATSFSSTFAIPPPAFAMAPPASSGPGAAAPPWRAY